MSCKFADQRGLTHLLLLIVFVGVLAFLLVSNTFDFKNKLFGGLYPKPLSRAAEVTFVSNLRTDPNEVINASPLPKPAYLIPVTDPTYHTKITRIGGDAGAKINALNGTGTWGTDARQHYNDDQAWNADQTLIELQNEGTGASSSQVYLDADTYKPKYIKCSNYSNSDDRWMPRTGDIDPSTISPNPVDPAGAAPHKFQNVRINTRSSQAILEWFDVTTCQQLRQWNLPRVSNYDIAQNPSVDGRFVALWNGSKVFVVDMDAWPTQKIGPDYDLVTNCGLSTCTADHLYISPSGKYLEVTYEGDHPRIFDVNPTTLAITPHAMPANSPECSGQDPTKGYTFDLGHEAAEMNPFDNNEDVMIGQLRSWCKDSSGKYTATNYDGTKVNLGQSVMVRMRDNYVSTLTVQGNNEAYSYHNSGLVNGYNSTLFKRPGWVYVSHWPGSGRFNDEIMAIKLDGSQTVQRFINDHTDTNNCYRCEAHPVPSRDGFRVIFASSWTLNCGTSCGSQSNPQAYVMDARDISGATPAPSATPQVTPPPVTPIPVITPAPTPLITPVPTPVVTPIPADATVPTLNVIAPTNGAVVLRNSVFVIKAQAFDNVGVAKVEFYVNNGLRYSDIDRDASGNYTYNWSVPAKKGAIYTIKVISYDFSGNLSSPKSVTVRSQ